MIRDSKGRFATLVNSTKDHLERREFEQSSSYEIRGMINNMISKDLITMKAWLTGLILYCNTRLNEMSFENLDIK